MKSFEYSVFIARCQPFHIAHHELIKETLDQADFTIIVLGSHNKAPNIKDPWTTRQREEMIRSSLTSDENNRVQFIYMRDYLYNDNLWLADIQQKISEITNNSDSIVLIGHEHDRSSYYLNLFPQWNCIKLKNIDECPHATQIRQLYFTHDNSFKNYLPPPTAQYLENFKRSDTFKKLKEEYDFINEYRSLWDGAPFPPTFVTVDAVVIKSGHILLVKRKGNPGKGLIALPGGFVNQHERIQDAALRELKEETGIKLPKEELEKFIRDQQVFDLPERSLRGRTISHAFLLDLKSGSLPQVKGQSDADKAWWMPISEFYTRESEFFEDHFHIVSSYLNKF